MGYVELAHTLGLLSRLSPVKVLRSEDKCSHCRACTKHCPTLIDVERKELVKSAECFGCLTCVSRCPAPGALDAALPRRIVIPPLLFAAAVVAVFFGILLAARLAGHWHSGVSAADYLRIAPSLVELAHP